MWWLLFSSIHISGLCFCSCRLVLCKQYILLYYFLLFLNSGLYLCGHSAGAHLTAMVLSTDWSQYGILPQIKGAADLACNPDVVLVSIILIDLLLFVCLFVFSRLFCRSVPGQRNL